MANQVEIHRMAGSEDVDEREKAADELKDNFALLPDKKQAWDDLHRLTSDTDSDVLRGAVDALSSVFAHVPDKKQASEDLHRLTSDTDSDVRWHAIQALGLAFTHITDKEQAWKDLLILTKDKDYMVRKEVSRAIGSASAHIYDKEQVTKDLLALTKDENQGVRWSAALAYCSALPHITDKERATKDLLALTKDEDDLVRLRATQTLGLAFAHITDKEQAWKDLLILTKDKDYMVRRLATQALGLVFTHIIDKEQAWKDLLGLTNHRDRSVRMEVTLAFSSAFAYITNKEQAWKDMHQLTYDEDSDVRAYAFYSLGAASIFKATKAENENEEFKKEIEIALEFFKEALKEATMFNPALFCLPFYRSVYTLFFKKEEAEAEVQRFISEAKSYVQGSKSKEKLLEAVENLGTALKEAQNLQDKVFIEKKSDLNAYRWHCDRACELLDTTEEKAPGASRLIRKGLPIIDESIKGIIAEIQGKAKAVCKQVKDTEYKEIGQQINNIGQELSKIRDPIRLEKDVGNMLIPLSAICKKIPKRERGEACELLEKIKDEHYIEDKLSLINMFLTKISSEMNREPKKEKAMTTIKINNSKSVQVGVGKDINQFQDSITPKRKAPKKQKTSTKQINPKEPAKTIENPNSPIPYLSELESEIADIFKSVYQKDRKPGVSEVNAKTLESLKHKLHDLKASGNEIHWLDMGCGDGRCLEVLDDIQDRGNIYYHGIDISHKFLDDAQMRARKYGIKSNIETKNTAAMKFDSEFDLVSAVLFLHEVDPLCLPYVIRNMLRALKSDGTLVISDFEGPYEQEEGVVSWGAEYLEKFLSNIGGARMSIGFVPSGEFPKELGFYRCYVKKPELDEGRFKKFIEGYGSFMKEKKEDSRKRREELRSQINKRVCEILKRPDIDTKNISDEEKALLRESMGKEYGIKALKIRLLTNEILFLDEKIDEFERGERCDSN